MIFAHNSGGRLGEVLLALDSCGQKEEERYSLYRKRSTKGFYGFIKCFFGHSFWCVGRKLGFGLRTVVGSVSSLEFRSAIAWSGVKNVMIWSSGKGKKNPTTKTPGWTLSKYWSNLCGGCSSCSWMLGNARYNFHNLIETLSPTMKGECSAQSFRGVIGSHFSPLAF